MRKRVIASPPSTSSGSAHAKRVYEPRSRLTVMNGSEQVELV